MKWNVSLAHHGMSVPESVNQVVKLTVARGATVRTHRISSIPTGGQHAGAIGSGKGTLDARGSSDSAGRGSAESP